MPYPKKTHAMEPIADGLPSAAPETHEEDLQALIDGQARRISVRRRRGNRMLLGFFALLLAAGGGAYGFVPSVRLRVNQFASDIKLVGRDLRMASDPAEMKKAYDKSLEKIGTRSAVVDDATRSLGVDPASVTDSDLSADERKLMGDEGRTVSDRNRMLQTKLGNMRRQMAATNPAAPSTAHPAPPSAPPSGPATRASQTAKPVDHDEPLMVR